MGRKGGGAGEGGIRNPKRIYCDPTGVFFFFLANRLFQSTGTIRGPEIPCWSPEGGESVMIPLTQSSREKEGRKGDGCAVSSRISVSQ